MFLSIIRFSAVLLLSFVLGGCATPATRPTRSVNVELSPLNYSHAGFLLPLPAQRIEQRLNGVAIYPDKTAIQSVHPAKEGRVVFLADDFPGYGKTIILAHKEGYFTIYSGVSEIRVKPKEEVTNQDVIATLNPQENDSLYFEIRRGYQKQNALALLRQR